MGGEGPALSAALQFLGAVIVWVTLWSLIIFGSLKMCGLLRVSDAVEEEGMDSSEHGVKPGVAGDYAKGSTGQGAQVAPS